MQILNFLEGKMPDNSGRFISDIHCFPDYKIEKTHNFIQWLFPLAVPSYAVPGSPVLEKEEIKKIRKSKIALENLYKSADWYANFLSRNEFCKKPNDHNHRRITRVIRSLRLLGNAEEAENFKIDVQDMLGDQYFNIPPDTKKFWEEA